MKNDLLKLLPTLMKEKIIKGWEEYQDCILVKPIYGLDYLALRLSTETGVPGQWFPGVSSLYWGRSRKGLYLVDVEYLDEVEAAREIYRQVVGTLEGCPWGIGAIARALIKWAGANSLNVGFENAGNEFIYDTGWHYYYTKPGYFEGDYVCHDITACYPTLFCRLQSSLLSYSSSGKVVYYSISTEIQERIWLVFAAMSKHKLLRNTCVGALAASRGRSFCNGQEIVRKIKRLHPLRPAALLSVRLAAELCHLAVLSVDDPLYSNTDCIVKKGKNPPVLWEQLGIKSSIKNKIIRDADIYASCVYRVGDYSTAFYDEIQNGNSYERIPEYREIPLSYYKILERNY